MNRQDLDTSFDLVMKLVDTAGELINKRINEEKHVQTKSSRTDFVTETDLEVEKMLMSGIREQFPTHEFIGEEEVSEGKKVCLTDAPTWIIDPIDGTLNFVHSFPHSCVSIALLVNKITEIGIVFNPMLNQKFVARRGQGATYNGRPIHVTNQTELVNALIMAEFGTNRSEDKVKNILGNLAIMAPKSHGIRCLGGAVLNICMVALGGADVVYDFGAHAWDYAAAEFIVREAGGVVMDPAGGKFDLMSRRLLAASTQELANQISKELLQYYPEPRDDS